ncbi:MAG: HAD family hydrolase [Anaerolineae bacterium]|jgi:HAD superfamily hydrolase (TIGR01490 family)
MGRVAALFDLDKTLLDASSGQLYARYLYRQGQMGRRELATAAWWVLLSNLGLLDMHGMIPRLLASAAGDDEREMRVQCDRWFAADVVPHITERGQQCVAEHEARGHVVAIVSASTQYVVRPMAEYLGFSGQYVCTHLVSENGRLTGEVMPPVCYGQGKVVWAERFAAEHDVDLAASYFYTDSISDLPLLERVGHPVAVNPDLRLRRLARKRGWPLEIFY